ncbi:MAG: dUTP diphosphatase [Bacteroidetes bacterium]|nr:dUTP diphosphatase [Bacteroidota bacterium]
MEINIINLSNNPLPRYQTAGSAGFDIQAFLDGSLTLLPGHRILVPTGLYLELPNGYEAQVRPRSGLALHHGITLLNTPGTIDSDYRGEIQVLMVNLGKEPFTIENGMRIAQVVVSPCVQATLTPANSLGTSTRGAGGFGHTGIQ